MLHAVRYRRDQVVDYARLAARRVQGLSGSKPRLAYVGDPGCGNVGDDGMYQALQEHLPHFAFTPFGSPAQERLNAAFSLGGPRYYQGVLLGGGTLISAYAPWISQTETALRLGLPLWAMGTGVGSAGYELAPSVDLSAWRSLLAEFRCVGVRGPLSLASLAELGVADNVRVVGDLALCQARPAVTPPLGDPPCFAVNLALPQIEDYGRGDYAALEGLEEAARTLCRKGWHCRPVAMHPRDILPLERFLCAIDSPAVPYLPASMKALMDYLAPCRFTAGVRLHAAVFSCCAGVPPLMLGYRSKCLDFMESMNLDEWHLPLQSARCSDVYALTLRLAGQPESLRTRVLTQSQQWQARLAAYFQQVTAEALPAHSGSQCALRTPQQL